MATKQPVFAPVTKQDQCPVDTYVGVYNLRGTNLCSFKTITTKQVCHPEQLVHVFTDLAPKQIVSERWVCQIKGITHDHSVTCGNFTGPDDLADAMTELGVVAKVNKRARKQLATTFKGFKH